MAILFCPSCKTEADDTARFCGRCGSIISPSRAASLEMTNILGTSAPSEPILPVFYGTAAKQARTENDFTLIAGEAEYTFVLSSADTHSVEEVVMEEQLAKIRPEPEITILPIFDDFGGPAQAPGVHGVPPNAGIPSVRGTPHVPALHDKLHSGGTSAVQGSFHRSGTYHPSPKPGVHDGTHHAGAPSEKGPSHVLTAHHKPQAGNANSVKDASHMQATHQPSRVVRVHGPTQGPAEHGIAHSGGAPSEKGLSHTPGAHDKLQHGQTPSVKDASHAQATHHPSHIPGAHSSSQGPVGHGIAHNGAMKDLSHGMAGHGSSHGPAAHGMAPGTSVKYPLHGLADHGSSHGAAHHVQKAVKSQKHQQQLLRCGCITFAAVVVVAGIIAAVALLLASHTEVPGQNRATLGISGAVVPGGSLHVHGSNFTGGGTITITIDGRPATITGGLSAERTSQGTHPLTSLSTMLYQAASSSSAGTGVPVRSDGTFDATIQLDPKWAPGSAHLLVATEQNSRQSAELSVNIAQRTMPPPSGQPTPTPTTPPPSGQPTSIPAPTPGQPTPIPTPSPSGTSGSGSSGSSGSGSGSGSSGPCIKASPTQLTLTGTQGQSTSDSQPVTLTNCGSTGTWSATPSDSWLNINPTNSSLNGGTPQDVSVSASIANLGPNTYKGDITFTMGASTQRVHVTLTVSSGVSSPPPSPGHFTVSETTLDFGSMQQGQSQSQPLTISNTSGQPLDWTVDSSQASGVTLDTSSGTLQPGARNVITVKLDTSQVQAGPYSGTLTFNLTNADNAPVQVIIKATVTTVTVTPPPSSPQLNLSSSTLTFNYAQDSTSTTGCSITPASQSVTATNSGGGTLTWTVGTPTSGWLATSDDGSNAPSTVTFTVNVGNLSHVNGTYTATVTITPSSGSSQTVTVTLNVTCFVG